MALNTWGVVGAWNTPARGLNVWGPVNAWSAVAVKALVRSGGFLKRISDEDVGTGLKPVVIDGGFLKTRNEAEGIPVVYDNGFLRLLRAGETLVI